MKNSVVKSTTPAYGIGSFSSRSDPMFIGQQVPAGVSVNVIPSHNLGPEHIFGDGRQRFTQFGDQNFNVMREGLTISHNEDLAFRNHNWKTAAFNKLVKKAREMTAKFEKEQRELKVDKVTGVENLLKPGRKEARLLICSRGNMMDQLLLLNKLMSFLSFQSMSKIRRN